MNSALLSGKIEPENLFLIAGETEYDYGALLNFSARFLNIVHENGYTKNGPVGIYAEPSEVLVFIIASCWLNNIPFVSFDPQLPDHKMQEYREKIRPEVVITDKDSIPGQPNTISLDSFQLRPNSREPETAALSSTQLLGKQEDIFGYFFTSGTSGSPKIVPLKRRQMISAATSSATNLHPQQNESWLLSLPLYHVGGVSVILRSLLYGSAILMTNGFNASEITQLLSTHQKTVAASLVPTMLKRLLDNPEFNTHRSFRGILLGGGPISTYLIKECVTRKIPIITSYGMTETCAQIAANAFFEPPVEDERMDSVGNVFTPNEVKICDEDECLVEAGESGIIWLRGPQVFDGYFNQEPTTESSKDWFNTGDFGRQDEHKNLFIEARRTDLIITGGENVSPYEVEKTLLKLKFIKEAAVFGVPDDKWGQKVVAAIVVDNSELADTEEMKEKLSHELQKYKIPKEFITVESLPKTSTGKIRREELRTFYQSK